MHPLLVIFRMIIIIFNIILICPAVTTETDSKVFFVTRLVFFLMLCADYLNATFSSEKLERAISISCFVVTLLISIFESMGAFDFFILAHIKNEYFIQGNANNYLLNGISPIPLYNYIICTSVAVIAMMGLELINMATRYFRKTNKDTMAIKPEVNAS
ncbi:hypothetical protein GXB79_06975 [Bacillus velezensis]|uniref:hypothetical protein n=1 Tax=Bacillus velezensis TaxID=492670 RepID=UPI00137720B9|nr:hypothetical protein [Bacillus velezensis]NCT28009.1 hypothetical protein [Bacillus velezensis]